MQIYINHRPVALKKGTSFEYVAENRLFGGADGYSLTITFPLKDCPQNLVVFGHINRKDVSAGKVIFDCELRDRNFHRAGCITITEINEAEVKTQFLDGRSEQNFDRTFDKVYINELNLGRPAFTEKKDITPQEAWNPAHNRYEAVALPWVNDYSGNIQNKANCQRETEPPYAYEYNWSKDTTGLSWQPYLLFITKKICDAVGYSYDFPKWEKSGYYRNLLICNALPYAWYIPEYARALPHWTVEEYFEKLGLFLQAEFDIDHRERCVKLDFTGDVLQAAHTVRLDEVVEEYATEVKVKEERQEYAMAKNLVYKECDHEMWKYYDCGWFIRKSGRHINRYETMDDMLHDTQGFRHWDGQHYPNGGIDDIYYVEECDTHFIIRTMSRQYMGKENGQMKFRYTCRLQPINILGGRIVNEDEDASQEEIEFVPAWIDDTDDTYGRCLFLEFSGYDEDNGESVGSEEEHPFADTRTNELLKMGQKDKTPEYYDRIYLGVWDGSLQYRPRLPHPVVEDVSVADDWSGYTFHHTTMRINNRMPNRSVAPPVDSKRKTTFKFLADELPDARAMYIIRGKRYLCEKLTATFTENGMSQLIKGVFHPVIE